MASEKLKKWVKQKREEGISEERIRKSLDKTGYDPSILDEIDDPFDGDKKDDKPSEDLFNSSSDKETGKSSSDEENKSSGVSFENDEAGTDKDWKQGFQPNKQDKESSDQDKKDGVKDKIKDIDKSVSSFSFPDIPSISLPSTPEPPSFSKPSMPDIPKRKLGAVLVLIMLIAGGAAIYSFIPDDFNHELLFGSEVTSSNPQTLQTLDQKFAGCPDAGVSIQNISTSGGSTFVDSIVTEEAWVVVQITQNGEMLGFSTQKVDGESQIKVNKIGNEAELRPLGCENRYSRQNY